MERININKQVQFFSSGSTLLDLALGGGWALGHIFNLVGDKSSGKTLLAVEGFANFTRKFGKCRMRYAETEARFDPTFAATLGFPLSVERPEEQMNTIEELQKDIDKFVKGGGPGLYILDSLDALSDEAEVKKFAKSTKPKSDTDESGEEKGSYGTAKAKKMSQLFRLFARDMEKNDCSLGVISQIRDRIGVTFGETKSRSGGHALDFYCSQIVWLAEVGKLTKEVKGQDRPIAVDVHAKVKKCSVGMPFREADFPVVFGYGVDDEISIINWIKELKIFDKEVAANLKKQITKAREDKDYKTLDDLSVQLKQDAKALWKEIEDALAPPISKYR